MQKLQEVKRILVYKAAWIKEQLLVHLQSHPSRIYFYSRLRQLLRMKLVRKVSRELDKERKASSAEHKNTVFKQVKNPQLEYTVSIYKIS